MIHLGTSGYVYDHWRHLFYPKGLPARRWLEHYARVFSTVELNATFYRLPTAAAVDGWREGTPPGFRFAAKGSRYLTHLKRLKDPGWYVYFNNDTFGHALRDALDLSDLLGDPVHCGDVVRDPRRTRAAALE